MEQRFANAAAVVEALRPADPVYCLRPHVLERTARRFVAAFPGDVLYAVKCNDDPRVLRALHAGGIRHFDTASIGEIRAVRQLFAEAECHYMHPVKSPEAIAEAHGRCGVRSFVLDHATELDKVLDITGGGDLMLAVRLATPRGLASQDLGGKFGATVGTAARLLRRIESAGCRPGLTFHVGSQCLAPEAYDRAIELVGQTLERAGVAIEVLDVGGGFPALYTGCEPPFEAFVAAIADAVARIGLPPACRLQCEPGRALVADGLSVIARVDLRRGDDLHLNDGVYGSLSELKHIAASLPLRVLRPGGGASETLADFGLFGPTCDSLDRLAGPYRLAADVREGDWIEIGRTGAYSNALRTRFNGFHANHFVQVDDDPGREPSGEPSGAPVARPGRSAA